MATEPQSNESLPEVLKGLGRDYEKHAQTLLLTAPLAILVYSLDKVGVIGLGTYWEKATWFAWWALLFASLDAGFRLIWIPRVFYARAEAARSGKAEDKERATFREWINTVAEISQIILIAVGFLALVISHGLKSYALQGVRVGPSIESALTGVANSHESISQIRLKGSPAITVGKWSVTKIESGCVFLESARGKLVLATESIEGFMPIASASENAEGVELQLEEPKGASPRSGFSPGSITGGSR